MKFGRKCLNYRFSVKKLYRRILNMFVASLGNKCKLDTDCSCLDNSICLDGKCICTVGYSPENFTCHTGKHHTFHKNKIPKV